MRHTIFFCNWGTSTKKWVHYYWPYIFQAFLIAFTSEFLPRLLYQYEYDWDLHGYANFTLAIAPNGTLNETCRYMCMQIETSIHPWHIFSNNENIDDMWKEAWFTLACFFILSSLWVYVAYMIFVLLLYIDIGYMWKHECKNIQQGISC